MPLQTISELLELVSRLPADARADAVLELDRIIGLPEGHRDLAFGQLALDLVPFAVMPETVIDVRDVVVA